MPASCVTRRWPMIRLALVALLAAACQRAPSRDAETSDATKGSTAALTADFTSSAWSVRGDGAGPLRIGMTFTEAGTATGSTLPDTVSLSRDCAYAGVGSLPTQLELMWVDGRLARIDVDSAGVATVEGGAVGDPESRIRELYAGRIAEEPHKYVAEGRYLIVTPVAAAGDSLRLVFETDGVRVTRYRVGRLPEVRWVEGCA